MQRGEFENEKSLCAPRFCGELSETPRVLRASFENTGADHNVLLYSRNTNASKIMSRFPE